MFLSRLTLWFVLCTVDLSVSSTPTRWGRWNYCPTGHDGWLAHTYDDSPTHLTSWWSQVYTALHTWSSERQHMSTNLDDPRRPALLNENKLKRHGRRQALLRHLSSNFLSSLGIYIITFFFSLVSHCLPISWQPYNEASGDIQLYSSRHTVALNTHAAMECFLPLNNICYIGNAHFDQCITNVFPIIYDI